MASRKIRLSQFPSITRMQTIFFFISDRNLVFLFHNEGFCPGAVGCAVSLQGTYTSGEPAGSKSLAGGADACKGLEKGGL